MRSGLTLRYTRSLGKISLYCEADGWMVSPLGKNINRAAASLSAGLVF
ncbi:MAG: hypothetical protein HUJ91_06440 [Bacteroidales bacterium]|nr:hypothetical protein [Bacteroidales bacterium]